MALRSRAGHRGDEGQADPRQFLGVWCVTCRQEHPVIMKLSQDPRLNVVGVNYKDGSENALRFLGELGNPFAAIGCGPERQDGDRLRVSTAFRKAISSVPTARSSTRKVGPFDENSLRNGLMPAIEKGAGRTRAGGLKRPSGISV